MTMRRSRDRDDDRDPVRNRRAAVFAGVVLTLAVGFGMGRALANPAAGAAASGSTPVGTTPSATADQPVTLGQTALQDECTIAGPLQLSPVRYATALRGMAASAVSQTDIDQAATQQRTVLDQTTGAVTASQHGTHVDVRCVPLGYRVDAQSASAADVAAWAEVIVGVDNGYAPTARYETVTVHLVRENGQWKYSGETLLDNAWAPRLIQDALPDKGALPAQMRNFADPIGPTP